MWYELGDEFWDITQDGVQLAIVSGNARASKATVRVFGSPLQAHAELVRLTEEKLAAGYQFVDDATLRAARIAKLAPRPPEILVEAQNPELEAAIIANPYDQASYAVYGDWLQSRGEPRGELIALQIAEEADPTTERAEATRDCLATHPTLTRGLMREIKLTDDRGRPAIGWRFGFIHRLSLIRESDEDQSGDDRHQVANMFDRILRHPSGRFVTEIRLRASGLQLGGGISSIGAHAPRTLRVLSLISPERAAFDPDDGSLDPIWRLPLTQLTIKAARQGREAGELSAECVRSLARVPATLEMLAIRFGGREPIDHLAPLFARTDLTALRRLDLRGWAFAGEACRQLAVSPFARQVESIDLGLAEVEPSGLAMLADRAAFPNLRHVGLAFQKVSTEHRDELEARGLGLEDCVSDPDDFFENGFDDTEE